MKKIHFIVFACCFILLSACTNNKTAKQVLLITNSLNHQSHISKDYLISYLDHWGIPFDTTDLAHESLPKKLEKYALIIASHPHPSDSINAFNAKMVDEIQNAVSKGTGLVGFGRVLKTTENQSNVYTTNDTLNFVQTTHYITSLHSKEKTFRLFGNMSCPDLYKGDGTVLISCLNTPLLWVDSLQEGRIVKWSTDAWMQTLILGPLGGLDDCLWKSFVWAARKPFVMRGLPPLVTMRVDDVAGRGELWNQSPLYWVKNANNYGLKPWLGLFIYNLNPAAIEELRAYLLNGQATAAPHALGRPPRSGKSMPSFKSYNEIKEHDYYAGFYYDPEAIPLRETEYDEFIYFDHQHFKDWNATETTRGLEAVDAWYARHQPLPMSNYFIAHWYEMGSGIIPHISQKWGMEFIAQNKALDMPWNDSVPWVRQGPFRLYESPGTSTNNPNRNMRGMNPVYYADFSNLQGHRFFNCYTEIRDDAGYEWAPDNDVTATIGRGVRQITRALNSMSMAVLFTHETDYIYRIEPGHWDQELQGITDSLKEYKPLYLTSDEALKIVRATKSSKIADIIVSNKEEKLRITFHGSTDIPSFLYVFTEDKSGIHKNEWKIPPFEKSFCLEIDKKNKNQTTGF